MSRSQRQQIPVSAENPVGLRFRDHTDSVGVTWNNKQLFQRGGIDYRWGRQADQNYRFVSLRQGILVLRPFSLQVGVSLQELGDRRDTQSVVTGTYRLNAERTLGTRLVAQNGNSNVYFAFAQRARSAGGTDLFVLLGDPNSERTKAQVTMKLVRPF
jgi:hypothetical protein